MRTYSHGDKPIEYVQVFGERNSGTTFLGRLLARNMRNPANLLGMAKTEATPLGADVFGYKHWFPQWQKLEDDRQPRTLFVVIYRSPYTWLKAMMDRPYALSNTLEGKTIRDLHELPLVGFMNGKQTQNESDPETGDPLTIFQLRAKKISYFEALKNDVANIAFLSFEELIGDPNTTFARLAFDFPSAFNAPASVDIEPGRQSLREYRTPMPFNPSERQYIDAHVNWRAEAAAGYYPSAATSALGPRVPLVILNGASGVGKTHMLRALSRRVSGIDAIEIDDSEFWKPYTPDFSIEKLRELMPFVSNRDRMELMKFSDEMSENGQRSFSFLIAQLARSNILAPDPASRPRAIIATCGGLPNVPLRDAPSAYSWLADRAPVSVQHVLIDIPRDVHIARLGQRGRGHLAEKTLSHQARKLARRDLHAATIADAEDLATYLEKIVPTHGPRPVALQSPATVRKTQNLRYIQIFGERNSGTNYLKRLLAASARRPEDILGSYATKADPENRARLIGYKHYFPRREKLGPRRTDTLFIALYKNPYTWIRSMLDKPYHHRNTLVGKSISDLPGTLLRGVDVHGRPIPDVHPETGAHIDLFQLRKYKVQAWTSLSEQVDHVVQVNYERLLVSPAEFIAQLANDFGHLFNQGAIPDHVPDTSYLAKYCQPEPFQDCEMAVMNTHIDWATEQLIGYEKGDLFLPALRGVPGSTC